jgi:hypothetical protein
MPPGPVAGAEGAFDQEGDHKGDQAGHGSAEEQSLSCAANLPGSGRASSTEHLMLHSYGRRTTTCPTIARPAVKAMGTAFA